MARRAEKRDATRAGLSGDSDAEEAADDDDGSVVDTEVFYNPYLHRSGGRPRRPRAACSGSAVAQRVTRREQIGPTPALRTFLQITPRGVLYDGEAGYIRRQTADAPRMFMEETEYLLRDDLVWPGLGPLADDEQLEDGHGLAAAVAERALALENDDERPPPELRFHTYDQVMNVVFADSAEAVPAHWRHHVVPSGNVIRLFGATVDGRSICVNVWGQRAYFYCQAEEGEDLRELIHRAAEAVEEPRSPFTVSVAPVRRESLYGYGLGPVPRLHRVALGNWTMARKIGRHLASQGRRVFEVEVDPLARLLVDRRLPTFGWCVLRRYRVRPPGAGVSTAELEVDCETGALTAAPDAADDWPCYRALAFDIECLSATGDFPVADNMLDPVVQISAVCFTVGAPPPSGRPPVCERHLFTIGGCASLGDGTRVYGFPSEYEMLLGFLHFLRAYSPEFLTGYNINAFDLPYILRRLDRPYRLEPGRFSKLRRGGRFCLHAPVDYQSGHFAHSRLKVFLSGVVILDMYPVCAAKANAPNFKLDTMAEIYLGRHKEDLSYKELPRRFVAGDQGRADVGRYCVQDSVLVRDLFDKLAYHFEAAAVARLSRLPMRRVIFDGQQVRIYSCLLEECAARGLVLPHRRHGDDGWIGRPHRPDCGPSTSAAVQAARVAKAASKAAVWAESESLARDDLAQVTAEAAGDGSQEPSAPALLVDGACGSGSASSSADSGISSASESLGGGSQPQTAGTTESEPSPGESEPPPGEGATGDESAAEAGAGGGGGGTGYQGATVLPPDVGFHHDPVLVFDFASLYPSIIMSHNLCYTTLLLPGSPTEGLGPDDVLQVDVAPGQTYRFVREHVRRSLLAELLVRWLAERRLVRERAKREEDPLRRTILDKQQLALKVTCNAFYGFTGVAAGMLPCLPVASSITKIGRDMLVSAVDYVHEYGSRPEYLERLGFPLDCLDRQALRVRVVYGDTDSLFVLMAGVEREALVRHAEAMAADITRTLFREPVRLEFEKMFVGLMLICKKRYVGRLYGSDSLCLKGVDLVRRTACSFVKRVISEVLALVFFDDAVAAAATELSRMSFLEFRRLGPPPAFGAVFRRLCDARDALYCGQVPVRDLVMTNVLSHRIEAYKQCHMPHLAVVRRLAERREEVPSVGDRIEYVLLEPEEDRRHVPSYQVAEDPRYAIEHGARIFAERYFEQVLKAVSNTLAPVFPHDAPRRDRFLAAFLPLRVYLPPTFQRWAVRAEEYVHRDQPSSPVYVGPRPPEQVLRRRRALNELIRQISAAGPSGAATGVARRQASLMDLWGGGSGSRAPPPAAPPRPPTPPIVSGVSARAAKGILELCERVAGDGPLVDDLTDGETLVTLGSEAV